jgi:hypothetical protein
MVEVKAAVITNTVANTDSDASYVMVAYTDSDCIMRDV